MRMHRFLPGFFFLASDNVAVSERFADHKRV